MKAQTILFFSMLCFWTSCKGQPNMGQSSSTNGSFGTLVTQLGTSLWYVFQDSRNIYWFAGDGEGVYRFDGKNIINFTTDDGLSSNRIRQIQEDKLGNLYFCTLDGVDKFDGRTFTHLHPEKSTEWKLDDDDMWFFVLGKSNEHGPYRFDGERLYNLEFPKHYLHNDIVAKGINPFFSPYEVYTIYKDRKGYLWFGTSTFGACRFDGTSIKWMYEEDLTIVPNGGTFGIRSIFEDRNGDFWICNTQQRFRFDEEKTGKSDRLLYDRLGGVGNAEIFGGDECIYFSHIVEDDEGNIWLTTWSQGVYRYDGDTITHYAVTDNQEKVNLVSMYKDRQGLLWLGTSNNGVFRFNGTSFERFHPIP